MEIENIDEFVRYYHLAYSGRGIDQSQAEQLELQLRRDRDSDITRCKLLGYYSVGKFDDSFSSDLKAQHILWFVMNTPDHPILGLRWTDICPYSHPHHYDLVKKAWLQQFENESLNDLAILKMLDSFKIYEPAFTESLLIRLVKCKPNSVWIKTLTEFREFWK